MVSQEPLGPCGYSCGASISGCSIESIVLRKAGLIKSISTLNNYLGICESEALAIQGHPHYQLGLGAPGLGPVVHCEVLRIF